MQAETGPHRLLFVCTANVCRSRIAEVLTAARVSRYDLPLEVASAGVLPGHRSVPPEVYDCLPSIGFQRLERPGQLIVPDQLTSADLIVGMAREHLREVVVMSPGALERAFTLRELVRRGKESGGRLPSEELATWLSRVGEGRELTHLLGESSDDDIADPFGGPIGEYRRTAREIERLVDELIWLLWPDRVPPVVAEL